MAAKLLSYQCVMQPNEHGRLWKRLIAHFFEGTLVEHNVNREGTLTQVVDGPYHRSGRLDCDQVVFGEVITIEDKFRSWLDIIQSCEVLGTFNGLDLDTMTLRQANQTALEADITDPDVPLPGMLRHRQSVHHMTQSDFLCCIRTPISRSCAASAYAIDRMTSPSPIWVSRRPGSKNACTDSSGADRLRFRAHHSSRQ